MWQGSRDTIFTSDNESLMNFVFASDLFKRVRGAVREGM